jgi:acyl-CoA reductase-like NAD-dependent aldehyde dehydrogenase
VDAADGAFGAWSQALPPERQRVFLAATDILERRSDEVVGLLARRPAAPSGRRRPLN